MNKLSALIDREQSFIVAALRIAAEQYKNDAAMCDAQPRVADQFMRQSERAKNLADRLEDLDCEVES